MKKIKYIVEIGSNWKTSHNLKQCWNDTTKLMEQAAKAGVDFIKFQAWDTTKFIHPEHPDYERFKEYELPVDWYELLYQKCKSLGVGFMTTPFDTDTADILHEIGQTDWKIASGDVVYKPLLKHVAEYNQPTYLSTGNANMDEIHQAVDIIRKHNQNNLTLLHCISRYPTKLKDLGFGRLIEINARYGRYLPIGYSNHVSYPDSIAAGATAVALGASVIETHIMPNEVATPDSSFAMTISQFKSFKRSVSEVDFGEPVIDEHELLWARRGDDGLRPWINWSVRDGKKN